MTHPSSNAEHIAATRPVLLFDMDDTLYSELDYMKSGARHALATLGLGHSAPAFETAMVRRFREGQRAHLMQDAFSDIGMEAKPELMAAFLSAYRGHTPEIALSPALRNALDRLLSHGIEMAVVSDGDAERQMRKVKALDLGRWFDPILLTGTLGPGIDKSHPLPFETLSKHFGAGRRFIFVADNPRKDFIHPLRAGWPSIHIRRKDCVYRDSFAVGTLEAHDEQEMIREIFQLLGISADGSFRSQATI